MRMSEATTASSPYLARRAGTSSEPICPSAPVTRIFFIGAGSYREPAVAHRPPVGDDARSPMRRLPSLLLPVVLWAAPLSAQAPTAVRELGQPDFTHALANRVDGRGLSGPTAVAIDHSRKPEGIWVLDTSNNRALGWRDLHRAAA